MFLAESTLSKPFKNNHKSAAGIEKENLLKQTLCSLLRSHES